MKGHPSLHLTSEISTLRIRESIIFCETLPRKELIIFLRIQNYVSVIIFKLYYLHLYIKLCSNFVPKKWIIHFVSSKKGMVTQRYSWHRLEISIQALEVEKHIESSYITTPVTCERYEARVLLRGRQYSCPPIDIAMKVLGILGLGT